MPLPAKTLSVLANPYAHLDHEGRPAGAFPQEFNPKAPARRYVGAERKSRETVPAFKFPGTTLEVEPAQYDYTFEFSKDPVSVPNTPYYRDAIKTGELIAADAKTYAEAGLHAKSHTDPKTQLAGHKAAAVAKWNCHYGEDPAATLAHDLFAAPTPPADAPAAAPAPSPTPSPEPALAKVKDASK